MPVEWHFKSETFDNCNCEINCGCQFNLPTTNGFCQSAYVGRVIEGHYDGVPIDGLKWAALYKWPSEIADGGGRRQIIIDEQADERQRKGLETIIAGQSCKPLSNVFSVFASTCSEYCETLYLPIELDADLEARTADVSIPGVLESKGRPKVNEFTNEPFHIALARPTGSIEFTYGELGLGSTTVEGEMEMAYNDTWALWVIHNFNQDGLVRERSRLTAWLDR